jgi:hypothetical protein
MAGSIDRVIENISVSVFPRIQTILSRRQNEHSVPVFAITTIYQSMEFEHRYDFHVCVNLVD